MSRPNINFLAQQLLIPNGEYSFALKVRDYRLLWGIFCGATSNVSEIPIYTPDYLDQQLNCVTRYVSIDSISFLLVPYVSLFYLFF